MKVSEVINRPAQVLPTVVKQQARVANVVKQIAASNQQQQPTEMDKVLAMQQMAAMKKQADKNYVQQLKQQIRLSKSMSRGSSV